MRNQGLRTWLILALAVMVLCIATLAQETEANNGIKITGSMKEDDRVTILLENRSDGSFNVLAIQCFYVQIQEILPLEGWNVDYHPVDKSSTVITLSTQDGVNASIGSLQFTFNIDSGEERIKCKWSAHRTLHLDGVAMDRLAAKGAFKVKSES